MKRTANLICSLGVCALLIVPAAQAEVVLEGELLRQERLGYYYFGRKDVFSALQLLTPVAEAGHAPSQFLVGRLQEAATNYEEAEVWYGQAAAQNHPEAAYALAGMYANGALGKSRPQEIYALYLQAAEQGFVPAMVNVAAMLRAGDGVQRDDVMALQWYQKAAQLKHIPAMQALQRAYRLGELGVARDVAAVERWSAEIDAARKAEVVESDKIREATTQEFREIEQRYLNRGG